MSSSQTILRATYRLQLRGDFGFRDVAALADYLAELGISHVYLSPCLQAAPGSDHGYDLVDYGRVSSDLGGAAAHRAMCKALGERGLGQIVDIVPNHMATSAVANAWWRDVLECGRASRVSHVFDIGWNRGDPGGRERVVLPLLSDDVNDTRALATSETVRLCRRDDRFALLFLDRDLPVALESLANLLGDVGARAGSRTLREIAASLGSVARTARDPEERRRAIDILRRRLADLLDEEAGVAGQLDAALVELAGQPDRLAALLEAQHYRLVHWSMANQVINYRRFFDIHELVGVRMEDPRVFADSHALILHWVQRGTVDGLRVDHPDGLRDPEDYFARLRTAAPRAWIIGEKILEPGEELPASWPIDGTSGYDFLNAVGGLFVDPQGLEALTALYSRFTEQEPVPFEVLVREAKELVLTELFVAEVDRLADLLLGACREQHAGLESAVVHSGRDALVAALACLPVYRTYVRPPRAASVADRARIGRTIDEASRWRPQVAKPVLAWLGAVLCGDVRGEAAAELIARFQQLAGAAMAKGLEDTAFYRYHRLISLNEVGGDPGQGGTSIAAFHRFCHRLQTRWPATMLTTSTHDTKRSEDVRTRVALLSQLPQAWSDAVTRWSALAAPYRTGGLPDRASEYLLWQTLVGAWPIGSERLCDYAIKAAREAKLFTSWIDHNEHYERVLTRFVAGVASDRNIAAAIEVFLAPLVPAARVTSLAQTVLKLTAPGIPDVYQGCELWDLSLTDPDNRRPVNYAARRRALERVAQGSLEEILAGWDQGLPKLWVTRQALRLRRESPALGPRGSYLALCADGEQAEGVVAFCRGEAVVALVPRFAARRAGGWGNTGVVLPPGTWRNILDSTVVSGGAAPVARLLARFPVALLARE